jgi:glycine C-acetyltransferase/8-amino-7-oxononanoate synthase
VGTFEDELKSGLRALEEAHLLRRLRRIDSAQGPAIDEHASAPLLNFSSNDYLGLATHPKLKEAAAKAIERFGTGSGASRLICGSIAPHHELEETLAAFKQTEAALTFSSGYATAVGTITALLTSSDVVVLDKLVHASIVDAARLSGAKLRIFRHNDLNNLEEILKWSRRDASVEKPRRVLIVTESLFSMDGDFAPLKEIVELKDQHGAWLMVDEAHATGLFGKRRCGRCEESGVSERVEVQMGTLGKAAGAAGGYIAGSRALIDYLVNKARSFVFSTAPVPASAAAAQAGIALINSAEGASLLDNLRANLALISEKTGTVSPAPHSPILPLHIGAETAALDLSRALIKEGILIPAIRYPTVARGQARLRLTMSASHTKQQIERAASILSRLRPDAETRSKQPSTALQDSWIPGKSGN